MDRPEQSDFELPAWARARLIEENYSPLVLDIKPFGCEPGARYVLDWQREQRTHDGAGNVIVAPRMALRWIEVTKVVRRIDRKWLVVFVVVDNRDPALMLRRGGGYTKDPRVALDREEAVLSQEDLARFAAEARAARVEDRERQAELAWRQERSIREQLREVVADPRIPSKGKAALLAGIQRMIAEAMNEREAA